MMSTVVHGSRLYTNYHLNPSVIAYEILRIYTHTSLTHIYTTWYSSVLNGFRKSAILFSSDEFLQKIMHMVAFTVIGRSVCS